VTKSWQKAGCTISKAWQRIEAEYGDENVSPGCGNDDESPNLVPNTAQLELKEGIV